MKTGFLLFSVSAVIGATLFPPRIALAGDKAACLDAASKAQTFRDAHKLVEAREKLRVCAAAQCPTVVQTDCATWLAEVEQGLPTVVITATDGAGRDRFDVRVTVDGQGAPLALQGQALPMNPGPHTLHLETGDGGAVEQQILVKEGMKNQSVGVVLRRASEKTEAGDPSAHPGAGSAATSTATSAPAIVPAAHEADGEGGGASGLRTVGWVTAGVGVVGLGVGAVFGLKAISDKNGAHCDATGACDAGPLGDANTSATLSTVGFVAGGVLLVAGAALVLFAPKGDRSSPSGSPASASAFTLKMAPLVGTRDAGVLLAGTW